MKKIFLLSALIGLVAIGFSSCAASKRDCQGVRHYKTKGGFYM